ncbi:hypothetical protein GEMRC1_013647 [Eukaryota sp. GEM-RC1]
MPILIGIDISHNSLVAVKKIDNKLKDSKVLKLSYAFKSSSVSTFTTPETLLCHPNDTLFVNYLHGDHITFPQSSHKSDSITSLSFEGVEIPLSVAFPLYRAISSLKEDHSFRDPLIHAVVTHSPSFLDESNVTKSIIKKVLDHSDIKLKAILPAVVSATIAFAHQAMFKDSPLQLMCNISYSSTGVVAFKNERSQCSIIPGSFKIISTFCGKTWDYDLYKLITNHINEHDVLKYANVLSDRESQLKLYERCKSIRDHLFQRNDSQFVVDFEGTLAAGIPPLTITSERFFADICLRYIDDVTQMISTALIACRKEVSTIRITGEFGGVEVLRDCLKKSLKKSFSNIQFRSVTIDSVKNGAALFCANYQRFSNVFHDVVEDPCSLPGVSLSVYPKLNQYVSQRKNESDRIIRSLLERKFTAELTKSKQRLAIDVSEHQFSYLRPEVALVQLIHDFHEFFILKGLHFVDEHVLEGIIRGSRDVIRKAPNIPLFGDHIVVMIQKIVDGIDVYQFHELLVNSEKKFRKYDCTYVSIQLLAQKFDLHTFQPSVSHSNQLHLIASTLDNYCNQNSFLCETPQALLVYFYYSKLLLFKNDLIRLEWFLIELKREILLKTVNFNCCSK